MNPFDPDETVLHRKPRPGLGPVKEAARESLRLAAEAFAQRPGYPERATLVAAAELYQSAFEGAFGPQSIAD